MSEKEGNTPALYGEGIMESVVSPEEEFKLNTPVPLPHIIPSSYLSPPFFPRVSNLASKEAKENFSLEGKATEEARKVFLLEKEGKTSDLYVEVIMESFGSP